MEIDDQVGFVRCFLKIEPESVSDIKHGGNAPQLNQSLPVGYATCEASLDGQPIEGQPKLTEKSGEFLFEIPPSFTKGHREEKKDVECRLDTDVIRNCNTFLSQNHKLIVHLDKRDGSTGLKATVKRLSEYPIEYIKQLASAEASEAGSASSGKVGAGGRSEVETIHEAFHRLRYVQGLVLMLRREYGACWQAFKMAGKDLFASFVDFAFAVPNFFKFASTFLKKFGELIAQVKYLGYAGKSMQAAGSLSGWIDDFLGWLMKWGGRFLEWIASAAKKFDDLLKETIFPKLREWAASFAKGSGKRFAGMFETDDWLPTGFFLWKKADRGLELIDNLLLGFFGLIEFLLVRVLYVLGGIVGMVAYLLSSIGEVMIRFIAQIPESPAIRGALTERAKAFASPFVTGANRIDDLWDKIDKTCKGTWADLVFTALTSFTTSISPSLPPSQEDVEGMGEAVGTDKLKNVTLNPLEMLPAAWQARLKKWSSERVQSLPDRNEFVDEVMADFGKADSFDKDANAILEKAFSLSKAQDIPDSEPWDSVRLRYSQEYRERIQSQLHRDEWDTWFEHGLNWLKLIAVLVQGLFFGVLYATEKGLKMAAETLARKIAEKIAPTMKWEGLGFDLNISDVVQVVVNFMDVVHKCIYIFGKEGWRAFWLPSELDRLLPHFYEKEL